MRVGGSNPLIRTNRLIGEYNMGKALSQEEVQNRIKQIYGEDVVLISTYTNKRSNITLHCNNCGEEWTLIAQAALYPTTDNRKKYCQKQHTC